MRVRLREVEVLVVGAALACLVLIVEILLTDGAYARLVVY